MRIDAHKITKTFKNKPSTISIQNATVDPAYSGGYPKLLFDGEDAVSTKTYPHLKGYTPIAGERVMVLNGTIVDAVKIY